MKKLTTICLALAVAIGSMTLAGPARADIIDVEAEQQFAKYVQKARTDRSLPKFLSRGFIRVLARDHSAEMVDDAELHHDGLGGRAGDIEERFSGVRSVCEVVGRATGVPSTAMKRLVKRLLRDGGKATRSCLLGSLNRSDLVGVGVARLDVTFYVTFLVGKRKA